MIYLTQTNIRELKKFLKDKAPDYVLVYRKCGENLTMKKFGYNTVKTLKNGKEVYDYNGKYLFDDIEYYFHYNKNIKNAFNINKEIRGVCK